MIWYPLWLATLTDTNPIGPPTCPTASSNLRRITWTRWICFLLIYYQINSHTALLDATFIASLRASKCPQILPMKSREFQCAYHITKDKATRPGLLWLTECMPREKAVWGKNSLALKKFVFRIGVWEKKPPALDNYTRSNDYHPYTNIWLEKDQVLFP